ncbi:hypothetical protein F6X40_17505 [Paraburkholderia sp. UCT31]|uniref:hypothetical protein n=1 Tax=Paraburkholderia sp. UCT31 TaxID=2615209 RepID=UPI00165527A6|nr:hypothetical protein [Paraburkholderia sp. UCT31]MBC8738558.1 hypothetical protein [Paraburkholderia sp. UCT31]
MRLLLSQPYSTLKHLSRLTGVDEQVLRNLDHGLYQDYLSEDSDAAVASICSALGLSEGWLDQHSREHANTELTATVLLRLRDHEEERTVAPREQHLKWRDLRKHRNKVRLLQEKLAVVERKIERHEQLQREQLEEEQFRQRRLLEKAQLIMRRRAEAEDRRVQAQNERIGRAIINVRLANLRLLCREREDVAAAIADLTPVPKARLLHVFRGAMAMENEVAEELCKAIGKPSDWFDIPRPWR